MIVFEWEWERAGDWCHGNLGVHGCMIYIVLVLDRFGAWLDLNMRDWRYI